MEAYKLEEEDEIPKGSRLRYNHLETGVPMAEHHVDTSDLLQKSMGEESWLGGRRSMGYSDGKLLITWGAVEMIKKQYQSKTTWYQLVPLGTTKVAFITLPTGEYMKKVRWTLILYEQNVGNIPKNMPSRFQYWLMYSWAIAILC